MFNRTSRVIIYILPAMALFLGSTPATGEEIDTIKERFDQTTGAALENIEDLFAIGEVFARLPRGAVLRQRAKVFIKGEMIRQETEAMLKTGGVISFLVISTGKDLWTVTPHGQKVKMDIDSSHGGIRPDPMVVFTRLSIKPGAKIAGERTWEGKPVVIVENPGGQRIWLDTRDMTPLKVEDSNPTGGKTEWIFHDFKLAGELVRLPRESKMVADEAVFYFDTVQVVVNAGLEEELFDPDKIPTNPSLFPPSLR